MTAYSQPVEEIVWHFAGYIHIVDELARSRVLYDGSAHQAVSEDFQGQRIVAAQGPSGLGDFLTVRLRPPAGPDQVKGRLDLSLNEADPGFDAVDPIAAAGGPQARTKIALMDGGGGGFTFPEPFQLFRVPREFAPPPDVEITVTYNVWAAQRIIQATQNKQIVSNNAGYVEAHPDDAAKARLHEMHTIDIGETLKKMFEESEEKIEAELPEDLLPEFLNAQPIMDRVKALHDKREAEAAEAEKAAKAEAEEATEEGKSKADAQDDAATDLPMIFGRNVADAAEDGDEPLPLGLYIDGERQDDDVEHPEFVRGERPKDLIDTSEPLTTIPIVGVRTEMGWNTASNSAAIYDLNEGGTTLIVKGDYFETNAIVQINIYKDSDQVEIAGLPKEKKAITEANDSSNVAELLKNPAFDVLPVGRFHAGLTWNVDVLDGDFVDVKMLDQYNWLYDNDVGIVTSAGVYSRLLAGGNEANGSATIIDYGKYDVIIVLGDYHEANIIYQKNYLIDDDILKAASSLDEDYDGDLTQSASWSKNTLLNDATIENVGAQDFEDLSLGLRDLIDAIGRGEVTFDPEVGWQLTGNGTGTLDILYVTGDYYDINVIRQTNVVADVDTAVQLLPDLDVGDGTEIKQIVSTGENATINTATIIDVGATFHTYLEGEHYEDLILVQAEIVIGDDDNVDRQNPDQLVNEVIAFIGSPDDDDDQPNAPIPGTTLPGDVLGQMMTG